MTSFAVVCVEQTGVDKCGGGGYALNLPQLTVPAFNLIAHFRDEVSDNDPGWETDDSRCQFSNVSCARFANEAVNEYHRRRPVADWFSPAFRMATRPFVKKYSKDPRILALTDVKIDGKPIVKIGRDEFDLMDGNMEFPDEFNGELLIGDNIQTENWIQDDSGIVDPIVGRGRSGVPTVYYEDEYFVYLKPVPDKAYAMLFKVNGLPQQEITWDNCRNLLISVPSRDVYSLRWWMEFLAWSRRDADTQDMGRAQFCQKTFDDLIGFRVSSLEEHENMLACNRRRKVKAHYR